MTKLRTAVYWLLVIVLAVGFLPAGIGKLVQPEFWLGRFTGWGLPEWLVYVVGVVEVVGGAALLVPRIAPLGAAMVGTIMVGAIGTKIANGIAGSALGDVMLLTAAVALSLLWGFRRREQLAARAADAAATGPEDELLSNPGRLWADPDGE